VRSDSSNVPYQGGANTIQFTWSAFYPFRLTANNSWSTSLLTPLVSWNETALHLLQAFKLWHYHHDSLSHHLTQQIWLRHQTLGCLIHPPKCSTYKLTAHFTVATCPTHLIEELGSFPKPPPRLHPNLHNSTIGLVQASHPKLFAHSPNQGIPNHYKTFSNLHHLSYPQVCRFSPWKQIALEPPNHLTSLQRTHCNT
jgi:hypothetical protein